MNKNLISELLSNPNVQYLHTKLSEREVVKYGKSYGTLFSKGVNSKIYNICAYPYGDFIESFADFLETGENGFFNDIYTALYVFVSDKLGYEWNVGTTNVSDVILPYFYNDSKINPKNLGKLIFNDLKKKKVLLDSEFEDLIKTFKELK